MNIPFRLKSSAGCRVGLLLTVALTVWVASVVYMPAQAATTSGAVTIDTAPLTVQASLPPNITLMLDDSGSMAYDFMPDWGYLDHSSNDALRDSDNNGTYYNANVIYSPPPMADGSSYPESPGLGGAFADGFLDQSVNDEEDVTQYSSNNGGNSYSYYQSYTSNVPTSTDPVLGCQSGDSLATDSAHQGQCAHQAGVQYTYYSSYGYLQCNSGDQLVVSFGSHFLQCQHSQITYTYYTPNTKTCPGGGNYSSSSGLCVSQGSRTASLFTYTTTGSNGNYVRHFVGKSQADCTVAPSGSNCDYSAQTQQNVANWFSYYRTRMLMAKSGLMSAFSALNADYRFGFGSIDGGNGSSCGHNPCANGNYKNLPSLRYSYSDSYNSGNNYIADLVPFGDGSDSNDQKTAFWNWVSKAQASGGTPLRQALDAVGKYYKTDQPWTSMSTDPDYETNENTKLACRQAFTILTTDGFWNGNNLNNGNVDNLAGPTYTDPNEKSYSYQPVLPFKDAYSDTLADVAMTYWKTDLRSDITDEVPTNTEDLAFWQHMVTFTIGLGFAPKNIGGNPSTDDIFKWASGGPALSNFSWPKPQSDNVNNIADLVHAAVDGHGGFYSATSPQAFAEGLKSALDRASERVGTGASLAANSTELDSGTFVYQANYYTTTWKGDLKALQVFTVDDAAKQEVKGQIATIATWTASSMLPAAANRAIYTFNSTTAKLVSFTGPSSLSTAEQNALGSSATEQQNIINYLRGDMSLEADQTGGKYHTRVADSAHFVLGDIVDSQPVYVGAPNANQFPSEAFKGSSTFAAYASNNASRSSEIYVAANDGMLHAFKGTTGVESFAYIPAAVITDSTGTSGTTSTANDQYYGLSDLANPNYATDGAPHQYFNDGELTTADAYFAEGSAAAAWHTVVVGTTGRGLARAVYALDVTDPSTAPKFLWERSAHDGNVDGNSQYLGQMVGKPIVAQVADGQWAVLIGNGFNSTSGTAALLQFDLATGKLDVHATDGATGNGLAGPAVWINDATNGLSSVAYAGDRLGRVWSFQISTPVTNATTKITTITATPDSAGTKLFTTSDGSVVQPITSGILAGRDPVTGNRWVFFGTGQYLATADLTDNQVQSWYGLIVDSPLHSDLVTNLSKGLTALKRRSIIMETSATAAVPENDSTNPPTAAIPATLAARVVTLTAAGEANIGAVDASTADPNESGWYIRLEQPQLDANGEATGTYNAQGERMVTPNQFQGSLLIGTSRIPIATDPCNPSGSGWIMSINPFTGTNPDSAFFDINGDGSIGTGDTVSVTVTAADGTKSTVSASAAGVGFVSLPNNPVFVGGSMLTSYDNGETGSIATSGSGNDLQRVSWRELINQ